MQHNSCRQTPRPALFSQKVFPLFTSSPPLFFSSPPAFRGVALLAPPVARLSTCCDSYPSLSLAAQGHVLGFFFSYLIKKSSLNVLYFIQFVQICSASSQEEEGGDKRGVSCCTGDRGGQEVLRERASESSGNVCSGGRMAFCTQMELLLMRKTASVVTVGRNVRFFLLGRRE